MHATYEIATLLQEDHLPYGMEMISCGSIFIIQDVCRDSIEIDSGRKIRGIELDSMYPVIDELVANQRCHFLSQHVEDFQRNNGGTWQLKSNCCDRVEWIRIILMNRKQIGRASCRERV